MLLLPMIVAMNEAKKKLRKSKMGRPTVHDQPMTNAERQKRWREKRSAMKRQTNMFEESDKKKS